MTTEKPPPEPSMDEILASIRQIISGNDQPQDKPLLNSNKEEDILDLTDILPEDAQKVESSKNNERKDPQEEPPLIRKKTLLKHPKESPEIREDERVLEPLSAMNPPPLAEESLFFPATLPEETQASDGLNTTPAQENSKGSASRLKEGLGRQTIEDLMHDMLKPLLKEWLDAHLPALVQRIVNEQVEKIIRQGLLAQHEKTPEKGKSPSNSH